MPGHSSSFDSKADQNGAFSKKTRKRSLRDLMRQRINREDIPRITLELQSMADRPAAIVAATLLEDAIQGAILRGMKKLSNEEHATMFTGNGPLASFGNKIRLANAFKLVYSSWAKQMEIIKNIRNVFAHTILDVDFSTPEIVEHTLKITAVDEYRDPIWGTLNKGAKHPLHQIAMSTRLHDPRSRFIGSCIFFAFLLRDISVDPEDFDEDDKTE